MDAKGGEIATGRNGWTMNAFFQSSDVSNSLHSVRLRKS